MVILRRSDLLRVSCHNFLLSERKIIRAALTFRMPGSEYSNLVQDGHWDGRIKFYDLKRNCFPLGLLPLVEKALKKQKIQYSFEDRISVQVGHIDWGKYSIDDKYAHQREAIMAFLKRKVGIVKVPTRGGKTYIAAEIIRLLKSKEEFTPTWFIVDSTDLFYQAIDDISLITGVPKYNIGQIKGEKIELKEITLVSIQTLQSRLKKVKKIGLTKLEYIDKVRQHKELLDWMFKLRLLIVDEIHEYSKSKARQKILKKINADYFLSLTATPKKNDKIASLNILAISGGKAYDVNEDVLVKNKVLAENKILMLLLSQTLAGSGQYRQDLVNLLTRSDERNQVIIEVIKVALKLKLKLLVMVREKSQGNYLSLKTGVTFLSGDDSVGVRKDNQLKFLSGQKNVLLVSYIWKKGITLPEAQIMLNAAGGIEQSLMLQIRGRILGAKEGKDKALFIDFIDDVPNEYFSIHSLKRLDLYEKQVGIDRLDIIDVNGIDKSQQIHNYVKNFFYDQR